MKNKCIGVDTRSPTRRTTTCIRKLHYVSKIPDRYE